MVDREMISSSRQRSCIERDERPSRELDHHVRERRLLEPSLRARLARAPVGGVAPAAAACRGPCVVRIGACPGESKRQRPRACEARSGVRELVARRVRPERGKRSLLVRGDRAAVLRDAQPVCVGAGTGLDDERSEGRMNDKSGSVEGIADDSRDAANAQRLGKRRIGKENWFAENENWELGGVGGGGV